MVRPSLEAIDDPERDVAIGLVADLEVLAAARDRNLEQRGAIENGSDLDYLRRVDVRRIRDHPPGRRPHADDVDRDVAGTRIRQRIRDGSTPRLAVGNDDEGLRVAAAAEQLLVLVNQPQAPAEPFLDVRIPRRVVLEAERRVIAQVIEEKEQGVGILREPDLRGSQVCEQGERDAIATPAHRFRERSQETDGATPPVRCDIARVHGRRAIEQNDDIGAGPPDDRHASPGAGQQLPLFVPQALHGARLAWQLARLALTYGEDRIRRVEVTDPEAPLPERRWAWRDVGAGT